MGIKKIKITIYTNFDANILTLTGFTNFENLILFLISLLLNLGQKSPKGTKGDLLKFCEIITKGNQNVYQVQFVVERLKPDLYELGKK